VENSSVTLSATGDKPAGLLGQISWALFEFARSPYISLVYIYVFPPYFASTVIGDPVHGQELWSFANTIVGVCVALLAPVLGAIADRTGRRKPWLAGIVAVMVPSCIALWWAMPGAQSGLPVGVIMALIVVLATFFQFSDMFHSSMLPSIASPQRIGSLSGLGIAVGNAGTLVALVVMLLFVALPGSGITMEGLLPDHPLFGLDPSRYEHNRIAGPVAGIWMLLLVFPLFVWTPDRPASGVSPVHAIQQGLNQLWITIKRARQVANVGLYLLARMLYTDGKVAILAYAGIYAAGIFGWKLPAMLLFGVILSPCAIAGGLLGGWIDARFGSRRAIQISISATCLGMLGAVSITPTEILFFIPYDAASAGPLWSFPYFRTLPEVLYIIMFMILAATVTAAFGNSRAMLARIAPISMMSQFYGLYGLSGTATSFLGHGLVATFTGYFHSQRAGFASTLILLSAGLLLMHWVREERAAEVI
jgi:UMF1 family MFS transporter